MFPGGVPRNPKHRHSMRTIDVQEITRDLGNVALLGLPSPQTFKDLFAAPLKIVPGIRSIEVLPDGIAGDPSYRFAGPLLLDDYVITCKSDSDHHFELDRPQDYEHLKRFFKQTSAAFNVKALVQEAVQTTRTPA